MIFWSPAECAYAKNAHHHHLIFFFSVPDPVLYIPVRPVCLLLLRSPSFQRDVRLCQTGLPGSTAPCGTKIYAWWVIGIDHDTVCAGVVGTSGQTILLNDRSDRSKPLRSIIDRKANLRSIICRSFIIVKWTGLLLWKQYIIITVRLGIWDNSHLL